MGEQRACSPAARWCWQGRALLALRACQEVLASEAQDRADEMKGPSVALAMGTALKDWPWFLATGPHCLQNHWPAQSSFPQFPEPWKIPETLCPTFCCPDCPVEEGMWDGGQSSQAEMGSKRGLAAT
jgi:hypothetical protein